MSDLGSVDRKIEWADHHIHNLEVQLRFFKRSKPYELITERQPNTTDRSRLVFKVHHPIPAIIPLRIGDVVHNLRSALDHLICAAVESHSGPGAVTTNTAFPIWRKSGVPTSAQYKALVLGKVKGASKDFIKLVLETKAHEGGDHEAIWALDYLDIVDKHRLTIAAYMSHQGLFLHPKPFGPHAASMVIPKDFGVLLKSADTGQVALEDGAEVFSAPGDSIDADQYRVMIDVAFGEPSVLKGEPLLPGLAKLSDSVKGLIDQFRLIL